MVSDDSNSNNTYNYMNATNNEIYFATNGTNMNMTSINNRNNLINNNNNNTNLHICNNNNNENLSNHHNFINNLSNNISNANNINNTLDLNSANLSNYQTNPANGGCYLFRNNHIPNELLSVNNQCQSANMSSNSTYTELQPAAYTQQQQLPSIDTLGCGNKSNIFISKVLCLNASLMFF